MGCRNEWRCVQTTTGIGMREVHTNGVATSRVDSGTKEGEETRRRRVRM
jgi:hypothetical protein